MSTNEHNDSVRASYLKHRKAWLFAIMVVFAVIVVFIFFRSKEVGNLVSGILSTLSPIFYGIAMAYVLNPVVVFFERCYAFIAQKVFKIKHDRYKKRASVVAIALSIILLVCIIWVLLSSILPQIFNTLQTLVGYIPSEFDQIQSWIAQFVTPDKPWTEWVHSLATTLLDKIEAWLKTDFQQAIPPALQFISSGVMSVVSAVFDFVVGICVAVYLLNDKHKLFAHLRKLVYAIFNKNTANTVVELGIRIKLIFNRYVYSTILGSLIVFTATFTFMLITDMPYALLISTLVCITNIIPFFGPFIGAIPSTFILLLHDPATAVLFALFTLILQQVEGHFLTPLLISGNTGISPFWVTVSLLLGGGMFGIGGLLFAVPIFSVIYYLIKVFAETRLAAKELPIESEKYLYNSDFDYTKINESIHNRIEKTKKRRLNRKNHTNAKD